MCLAGAETTVGLGWAPSVLSTGRSHGIAVLMGAGLVFVKRIVWLSAHEREVASIALAHSEDRFRRLLVNAADAVVVLDRTGTIVFATEAIESLTGYSGRRARRAARRAASSCSPRTSHGSAPSAAAESGEPSAVREDIRVHHRDGSLRWCQISMTNQLDDPVIEGIVVNVHDITERREAAASVAAAEARFRTLVQHAADGIIMLDADARCQYVSPSYERLTGSAGLGRSSATSSASSCNPDDTPVDRRGLGADAGAPERDDARARARAARRRTLALAGHVDLQPSRRPDDRRDHPERPRRDRAQGARRSPRRGVAHLGDDRVGRAARDRPRPVATLTAEYAEAKYCLIRLLEGDDLRLVAAPGFPPDDVREGREHRRRGAAVVRPRRQGPRRGAHRLRRARPAPTRSRSQ